MFDVEMIRSCILDTFRKRLWGAWQVLKGKAGIVFFEIKAKDIYKED